MQQQLCEGDWIKSVGGPKSASWLSRQKETRTHNVSWFLVQHFNYDTKLSITLLVTMIAVVLYSNTLVLLRVAIFLLMSLDII